MPSRIAIGAVLAASLLAIASDARAQDAAAIVARAREQLDTGAYADVLRTLSALKGKNVPSQLAIEAGLIETNALIVTQGADAAQVACGKAIVAASYDPDIAREQSPKVRDACKAAAKKVRSERLAGDGAKLGALEAKAPEVAYQPVRISTTVDKRPPWLKVVARIESSGIEGSFDVPLLPSDDGPLLGTLDPAWIKPKSKLVVALVAQDKFGDLGDPTEKRELEVPAAEAAVLLGTIPEGAKVTLDDEAVKPDAQGKVTATAGKHDVALTLSNGASAETNVELRRGQVTRVALSPQIESPSRVWPWVTTGTSLALLAAGGVLLINAEARRSELEDAAAQREPGTDLPATDYAELESIDSERTTFQYVGIGLLAGGGAVAILATVLWLVPTGGGAASAASTPGLLPVVGPGFVGVSGRF
ncbi:MAG TPA: hypothetical protein VL400_01345 [Polyangiaceae bacterium]|nr:hypothetical protein [Polyangiaceae bacterium]